MNLHLHLILIEIQQVKSVLRQLDVKVGLLLCASVDVAGSKSIQH